MEALSDRFSVLQEKLMDLYESGVEDLATQIQHWKLLRQEQVLFHYARKHGIMRLGYQPVPSLASSESKAKDAIAMGLLLESLQNSKYANEPWTLVETSLETVRSPPVDCFKKGPKTVEVYFDGDPDNVMPYTVWSYIYYQTDEDTWEKVEGQVDYTGAYYMEGQFKTYYIKFETDAKRYGTTGTWEVHVNKDTVFTPVTSSTPPVGDASNNPAPGPVSTSVPNQRSPSTRRYGRKASSPTTTTSRRQKKRQREREETSGRRKSRSRSRSTEQRGGRGTHRSSSSGTSKSPKRGGSSGGGPLTRSRSRSRSRTRSSVTGGGVAPDEVGATVRSLSGQHSGRLAQLLDAAKDPPVMLLRGNANTLKCYRYRFRKKHAGGFQYISTTWSWVGDASNDRIGRARMLISFHTEGERERCLQHMKLPVGVEWSYGHFDDL
uniref:Regulatory protein E2 n=1 Tax=Human papillomavirus TaxID=10566 RepID=A0A385PM19_9PAPI|nr:MAG: E2 protein [Human papillomavirus]